MPPKDLEDQDEHDDDEAAPSPFTWRHDRRRRRRLRRHGGSTPSSSSCPSPLPFTSLSTHIVRFFSVSLLISLRFPLSFLDLEPLENMAEAAPPPKILYIVVEDDRRSLTSSSSSSFRYTRWGLRSTLQFMGCKARHAFKISSRVFEVTRIEFPYNASKSEAEDPVDEENMNTDRTMNEEDTNMVSGMPFELYKRQTTVVVSRDCFLDTVCEVMSLYNYIGPNQRADLLLACRIREKKESMTVLLCGTSGCGKSTLSSLLGSRLGITKVISTDSIRHMMRSFVDEKQNPLLWASTYHAGEFLDPVAVSEAKAKRKAKKLAVITRSGAKEDVYKAPLEEKNKGKSLDPIAGTELIGKKRMAVEGFKAQSEMVIDSLDRLITAWEERKESVIIEGVHLSLNFVMGLMKKHPSIIPFMIYITNEDKHLERFAVRAKYMTLDPERNKYVKYIKNIRSIQDYLCNRADKHLVPKINNTNVDRSVAVIHATVFSCLRKRIAGEQLYDPKTNTVAMVNEEYRNQLAANFRSSKGMFQLIQRKGSSRRLMALLNTDGSVAKAWPVEPIDGNLKPISNGKEKCIGNPMYGPLQIGKAEPVNLQFGNFGISAWPSDTGGTSRAGSVDGSMPDELETGSRHLSSCCSSPKATDGASKELQEEFSVSGSEEEADDPQYADSDEDLSDSEFKHQEEVEGSVDENSTKSDEECEDLAIRDGLEIDYWTDDDEDDNNATTSTNEKKLREYKKVGEYTSGSKREDEDCISRDKYQHNLNRFFKMREHDTESCSHSLLSTDR